MSGWSSSDVLDSLRLKPFEVLEDIGSVAAQRALFSLFEHARTDCEVGQFDLVILAARRLSCLYLLLRDAGYPELGCPVYSDRVMETAGVGRWRGKRVLILDDSVLAGTTIQRLATEVRARVGSQGAVEVRAAYCDQERCDPHIHQDLGLVSSLEVSSREIDQISLDLTRTLYRHHIPYFTDFPLTRVIVCRTTAFRQLLGSGDFISADVTSPIVAGPGMKAYSLVPRNELRRRFAEMVGAEMFEKIRISKLRVFTSFAGEECAVSLVPIVTFAPLPDTELDRLLDLVRERLSDQSLQCNRWTPRGRLALLQHFASAVLLSCSWKVLQRSRVAIGNLHASFLREESTDLHFGPKTARRLARAFNRISSDPAAGTFPSDTGDASTSGSQTGVGALSDSDPFRPPPPGHVLKVGDDLVRPIVDVFVGLARKEKGPSAPVSGDELMSRLDRFAIEPSFSQVLSSFALDVCNDIGVAVPTIQVSGNPEVVGRCYKDGENTALLLADPDRRLLSSKVTRTVRVSSAVRVRHPQHQEEQAAEHFGFEDDVALEVALEQIAFHLALAAAERTKTTIPSRHRSAAECVWNRLLVAQDELRRNRTFDKNVFQFTEVLEQFAG